ncbi:hypothetical protein GCM10023156_08450 [Novipirellula rosea]|uniref:Uncharacterized protein n=1 Tax=Novipirellula rosea TaxID=1031540 RepID=A0ABP8MDP3_9BACT
MQQDGNDYDRQLGMDCLAQARSMIKQATDVDEQRLRDLSRLKRFETTDGQIISGNVVRLLLHPIVGCGDDSDLKQGLEATLSAVIECTEGRARMAKREQGWAIYAVIAGSSSCYRGVITWLAHMAVRNKWSLVEDLERP